MLGRIILALDGVGVDGQAQGGTDMGLIHLTAHDLHLGKGRDGFFAGLEDAVVVVIPILVSPVLGVDVHFQAFLGIQGSVCCGADQLNAQVERMLTDIFHGDALG